MIRTCLVPTTNNELGYFGYLVEPGAD
ncbi:uncharacterized protein METZ01_LOCUS65256 [marine metagenome]|uniref:Uncharacterized protein n=1 Tax=marine metagenome TaxID=408172 RepID=A0A381T8B0_9ZZZZ